MIHVQIDQADLPALRERIARWCPEADTASEAAFRRGVETAIADAAARAIVALRIGCAQEEASFRAAIRREVVASVSVR
jgi:hypothetical protein